jgi:hypothetical protein
LREWIAKKAEREKKKEDTKRERWDRMKAEPKHNFDDSDYIDQKATIAEELEDALQQGQLMKNTLISF